jgi:hypothetical protein
MTDTSIAGPTATGNPEFLSAVSHEEKEYHFYKDPKGNPPGQIKAYLVVSRKCSRRRVMFDELPTVYLKETFVKWTGKTAKEIGVTIAR